MNTKNKMIALLEIVIVLCSVFLVATPAIAADETMQKVSANTVTTASEDDYVLGVYGNANEDDTIDMGDVVYTKLAIFGKKPKTELCDAKYDGRINVLDVIQTKLIILGKEKEITILDGNGEPITVSKPVERIVVLYMDAAELLRILNAGDKIVGVSDYPFKKINTVLFPELSELPSVGGFGAWSIDYEAVLNLNPDVLLTFGEPTAAMQEKLPGVAVIFLGLYRPNLSNPERSKHTAGVRKMGYILDKEEEAEEFVKWRIGWINEIKSRTEGLSEDEKPRVFNYCSPKPGVYTTYTKLYKASQMSLIAGGKNIADDLPGFVDPSASYTMVLDPEWVIGQNPDFIVAQFSSNYDTDDPSEMAALRDDIMSRIQLANVNAVKTENVYIISGNYRNDASGYFIGAAHMAKLFHPDLFEDMDPLAIHQEYLTRFQHFDYNVFEHGVWVCPPLE